MRVARRPTALALALAALLAGCECGDAGPPLATLARRAGDVQRNPATQGWSAASVGDTFVVGDAVRTRVRSSADLRMARGAGLRLAENTTVRFSKSRGPRRVRLAVETGQTEIETGDEELWIESELGAVRIDPTSRVRLDAAGGMQIEVVTGSAIVDRDEGADETLAAGQRAALSPPASVAAPPAQAADAGATDRPAAPAGPGGGVQVDLRGGQGEIRDAGATAFTALAPGATGVSPGAVLRLAASGRATVRRGGDEASLVGPTEVVVAPSGASLLRATSGATSATATHGNVRLEVPGGAIVLRAGGTRARVAVGRSATEVEPQAGSVLVDATEGPDATVGPGQLAVLSAEGTVAVSALGGGRADVTIAAGESPVIHDAGAPTAVGVTFGTRCSGTGTVEITGARRTPAVSGTGRAVVTLRAGVWGYRVRCANAEGAAAEEVASGTITVRADTGAAPLAKRVAHNVLDADGRNYSVLYQNLLPSLTLRWGDAPSGGGFTLRLEPQGGRGRAVRTAGASHTFRSGEVAEGRYRFWFESSSGARSPATQLRLAFDNATPAATLRDVPGAPAGSLRVSGLVEDGWQASIDGRPLELDGHNRFVADLSPGQEAGAAAIRLEKAGRGVHYYLRRPAREAP